LNVPSMLWRIALCRLEAARQPTRSSPSSVALLTARHKPQHGMVGKKNVPCYIV
jgi:hypothetical protein